MYKKSWFIPIGVLILSIFSLMFYQSTNTMNTYATASIDMLVDLNKNASDILSIEVTWPTHTILATREDNLWVLPSITEHTSVSNSQARILADSSYVYHLINNFVTPGNMQLLEATPEDLLSYGIHDYSLQVDLYDTSGNVHTLIQGDKVGNHHYYAYNPATQSIYAVVAECFDLVSYDTYEWFNKDYIGFNTQPVSQIGITYNGSSHTLAKDVSLSDSPYISTTLSDELVDDILRFLTSSRATSYVAIGATSNIVSSYGFDENSMRFSLSFEDGSTNNFRINTSSFNKTHQYILLEDTHTIITVPKFSIPLSY